jgi:quinol-cytochrome oxidoreductase complex cytochrome b subunit
LADLSYILHNLVHNKAPTNGWSELAPTNAPVEDEPVQPVLRMNILLARCVFFFHLMCFFFFTSSLPHLPPPSYPPSYPKPTSPSYLPPTNPTPPHSIARARLVERKLELWSCGVGAVELEQELERPPDPRPHD